MEQIAYNEMSEEETQHWWYVGRRAIIKNLIAQFIKNPLHAAVDIGCGTGANIPVLQKIATQVEGWEMSETAIALAHAKNPGVSITKTMFPSKETNKKFDLVTLFDVLEHIKDDHAAAQTIEHILSPGGYAVITVPAFSFLWGEHDIIVHHQRRYTKNTLLQVFAENKLKVVHVTYFNTLLFPLIASIRLLKKWLGLTSHKTDNTLTSYPLLNTFLTHIFLLERRMLQHTTFPFGVSLFLILQKNAD